MQPPPHCLLSCPPRRSVNQTDINLKQRSMNLCWWTVNLPQSSRPSIDPPSANSCTLPKTPSQLIRHCLLPLEPVHKRPPRSQRAFPLKAASLVAPRNASRFGNRQSRVGWGWGGRRGLGSWIIGTAPSSSCAVASQSKIGGQQKEMRSTPRDRRHFTSLESSLNLTLWSTNTHKVKHTHYFAHTRETTMPRFIFTSF